MTVRESGLLIKSQFGWHHGKYRPKERYRSLGFLLYSNDYSQKGENYGKQNTIQNLS